MSSTKTALQITAYRSPKQPMPTTIVRLCVALVMLLAAVSLSAQSVFEGRTAGGSYFSIAVPAGWQPGGGLVLFNHGYSGDNPAASPSLGPAALRERVLSQGFALAASSFSQRGWALFVTEQDHRELLAAFRARFGQTGPVIAVGGSMGGVVAMQQAEQADLGVVGVYALCAPLAGSRIWDQALDIRLVYDALCDGVSGGDLPRGPVPYLLSPGAVSGNSLPILLSAEMVANASLCLGINIPPWAESSGMRDRKRRLQAITGVQDDFLLQNLYYATFALTDLYYDPRKLNARPAFDNTGVDYGDTAVNAAIRRVAAVPLDRYALTRSYTPTGRVGAARVLTTHTTGDGLVVPEHARALEGRLAGEQWARALVTEAPGQGSHCGYSDPEVLAGFDALVAWLGDANAKPDASTLQQRCSGLVGQGLAGACRYGPVGAGLGSIDSKIRPRSSPALPIASVSSGLWYDPTRSGEGYLVEALPDGRALIIWFTFPRTGQVGSQRWMIGTGTAFANGVDVDLLETRGGSFGAAFDPAAVQRFPFGTLRFVQTACGEGELSYQGVVADGSARRTLRRLTRLGDQRCPDQAPPAGGAVLPSDVNGTWYDPARSGEGFVVQADSAGGAQLVWFTYDAAGTQRWLFGTYNASTQRFDLVRPVGTRFGPDFSAAAVVREEFGTLQLDRLGCDALRVRYRAVAATDVGLDLTLTRLTTPSGIHCTLP